MYSISQIIHLSLKTNDRILIMDKIKELLELNFIIFNITFMKNLVRIYV
jgi:hypothetical protein